MFSCRVQYVKIILCYKKVFLCIRDAIDVFFMAAVLDVIFEASKFADGSVYVCLCLLDFLAPLVMLPPVVKSWTKKGIHLLLLSIFLYLWGLEQVLAHIGGRVLHCRSFEHGASFLPHGSGVRQG